MQELIQQLVSQLGVQDGQAKGGAGLLFKLAKDKLGDADFGQITDAVGNVDDLIGAAPKVGGAGGLLGSIASAVGGVSHAVVVATTMTWRSSTCSKARPTRLMVEPKSKARTYRSSSAADMVCGTSAPAGSGRS